MLREYISPVVASLAPAAGKPSPCPNKGESDGAAVEPTDVTTVQVPAEPQGQPQPAAVARVEAKKYKMKSEHPGNKDKKGGPSQPAGESEVEIITDSLTYESLRNLQKDLARQGREAYTTWLLWVWDLIGTGVQLDSGEARNLGPLTQDSGVNQVFVREPGPLSLWGWLLMSVQERFVQRDRMQEHHHRMRWKTIEEGIQKLREVAVLEVLFGRGGQHDNDPDKVRCTGQILWNLASLGPSQYATFIATIHPDNNRETVGSVANKLRNYESMISGSMQAQVSALAKELREEIKGGEARENQVYWMVWIRWPGTSEPQKYEALVDTGSQCTLIPLEYVGTEPISITRVMGGSQELTLLEAKVSLTGKEWQKHPIVTGAGAPHILGIDFLRNGYYKDSKGLRWAFGITAVEAEGIKKLNSLPGLLENPSEVGLLKVEEQRVPVATSTVHRQEYRTNRDAVIPIHKMIHELETQGVVSKTHSPFNSPIWPVCKSDGEWRLTVDYHALNEVTPPLSAAVPDMLELQYELESKAAKWYATIDIANAFFSILLAAECKPQFAFTWRDMQYTWNQLPQGWKHSPTICHGLIQAALEKDQAGDRSCGSPWPSQDGPRCEECALLSSREQWFVLEPLAEGAWESGGRPLGFWSRSYRGSKANYTRTEKEILAAYEGVQAASEVIGTGAQLLLAPRLPVLRWMFKGKVPSTHHATDAIWSKWIALITQHACTGNSNCPGILEIITNWTEGENFGLTDEEEQEQVTRAKEGPP
ncbi:hypothetical protein DUI87_31786 [Hirundo rustica rustica]|uniref:ribonuclease H n=1 Tax=Hirundo rustica rustica TaxID=333673 RepID=A0A3M0ITU5_HIRRU|nr:hypothetical protein DUI87_31786 [Hirundo rustica rustica]